MMIAVALFLVVAQSSPDVTILGVGNRTCGAWTDAAKTITLDATHRRREFTGWLMGYLSALNVSDEFGGVAVAPDGYGYVAWVDDYCSRNPLDTVYLAAASLTGELIARENH